MYNLNFARFSIFKLHLLASFSIILLFSSGCASYKVIPRHRSQIQWYDVGHWTTWMLFGNDDDGIFGEDAEKPYKPSEPNDLKKAVYWMCRNPLHNFCFYTIGSAYCTNSELVFVRLGDGEIGFLEYYPIATRVFGGKGTSLLFCLHGWKPFISLRIAYCPHRSTQFYLGWRERGNFGIKCVPYKSRVSSEF